MIFPIFINPSWIKCLFKGHDVPCGTWNCCQRCGNNKIAWLGIDKYADGSGWFWGIYK